MSSKYVTVTPWPTARQSLELSTVMQFLCERIIAGHGEQIVTGRDPLRGTQFEGREDQHVETGVALDIFAYLPRGGITFGYHGDAVRAWLALRGPRV